MWIAIKFIVSLLFLSLFFLAGPAFAQDAGAQSSPNVPGPEPTRIEADSDRGEIRFYVDDALSAVLKEDGLHVRQDIHFGGQVVDYGEEGFDEHAGQAAASEPTGKGKTDEK